MPSFIIEGQRKLSGSITPQGAKNEALEVISATLLTNQTVTISNVPEILDVMNLIDLMQCMGVEVKHPEKGTFSFKAEKLDEEYMLSADFQKKSASLRGSVMMLGPLITRFGHAQLPQPGGDKIGRRRGTLISMNGESRMRLEFIVPSRGLFGYRSEFLTDTRGEGVMSAVFEDYEPVKGDIPTRNSGALVAWEDGIATSYALFNIQDRGELFIEAGVKVYNGMIIGRNSRPGDIDVNVCKKKHMTNSRNSAAAEEALKITGVHVPTLEEAMEFIDDDELVEITPKSIRMRKKILGTEARKKLESRKKNG